MKEIKANLVLRNGSIYTADQDNNWAQAIAIKDNKIIYVGCNEDIEAFIGTKTTVMDLFSWQRQSLEEALSSFGDIRACFWSL